MKKCDILVGKSCEVNIARLLKLICLDYFWFWLKYSTQVLCD